MNADLKNQGTIPEDIDLLLLIERAILFFSRYKWVYIIATAAGLALGSYFYFSLSKIYQSRLVIHSFLLTNQEEIQIANNWNDLLKKKEYSILAQTFHCPEDILYRLKRIKTDEIQKVYTPANPNGFVIEVNVTDNSILPELEKGIVYAYENGEYVKDRIEVKKANYTELIDKTTQEIKKLDSTKQTLENIIGGSGKSSSSLIIDGSSINRELIEMNEKLLSYKEALQFSNAVQVFQSFNQFREPVGPHLLPWLAIGLMLCYVLAFVYTLFSSIRRRLKYRAQHNTGR
jgi:prefoldin subunit 5